ncbi:MAG: TrbC/VirB2 family protein [Oligoflexia bacterium]|nr:TrbC/VirB2 family protein [Oligoflexia bacterium]MDE0092772.1 TrbC/VirB2 family protein [Oligoflexia bacterium]
MKNNFFKKVRGIVFTLYLLTLSLPYYAVARDFLSSVENASNEIRQIIAVVGVLALMIAGVCFYWSKKLGMEKLSAAIIGTVVFATASTVFTLFYRAFN